MSKRLIVPQPVPGFLHIDQNSATGAMEMKTNLPPLVAIGVAGELITNMSRQLQNQNAMIVGQKQKIPATVHIGTCSDFLACTDNIEICQRCGSHVWDHDEVHNNGKS